MTKILSTQEWTLPPEDGPQVFEKPLIPITIQNHPISKEEQKIDPLKDKKPTLDHEDLSADGDDDEIDCYILSPQERDTKEKIWYIMNKDYLAEAAEKKRIKELLALKPKGRKNGPRKRKVISAADIAQSVVKNMNRQSSRINMDAYNNLFSKLQTGDIGDPLEDIEEEVLDEEEETPADLTVSNFTNPSTNELPAGDSDDDDPIGFL